jgi:hypothetical protein
MTRFSQLYLERGAPTRDSSRFRHRLGAYFSENLSEHHNFDCRQHYERETGSPVPWTGSSWVFSEVFRRAELRDVLDAITITHNVLVKKGFTRPALLWKQFVGRVMHEENVGYRVDDHCVIHYHVDEEFERNRASTLSVLDLQQLGAVRSCFEDAYRHLDSDPRDTKAAVRSIFEALESAAKLIVPTADRLTRNLCVQKQGGNPAPVQGHAGRK